MRKIEKGEFPATEFLNSLNDYIKTNVNGFHPEYSSANKHYLDVFFSLLCSQKGLCAYTESLLIDDKDYIDASKCFENGRLREGYLRKGIEADIEHYDSSLKKNYGWDVKNLFLCRTYTNRDLKKQKSTLQELKPDNPDYSPWKYLRYNFSTHRFVPNPEIQSEELKSNISHQLDNVLGINGATVISLRRNMLLSFKKRIYYGEFTYEKAKETDLKEFFTAFDMSESELKGV